MVSYKKIFQKKENEILELFKSCKFRMNYVCCYWRVIWGDPRSWDTARRGGKFSRPVSRKIFRETRPSRVNRKYKSDGKYGRENELVSATVVQWTAIIARPEERERDASLWESTSSFRWIWVLNLDDKYQWDLWTRLALKKGQTFIRKIHLFDGHFVDLA